jgi:6,7-dimethyl-8-ribityllumazine synthase
MKETACRRCAQSTRVPSMRRPDSGSNSFGEPMNQTSQRISGPSEAGAAEKPFKVAVIAASWHKDIVTACTDAIQIEFGRRCFYPPDCLDLHHTRCLQRFRSTPCGTRTAPETMTQSSRGLMNGGIYRHEFVASAVIDGLVRVQLDTDVPTFSAVLTPRPRRGRTSNVLQGALHHERCRGSAGLSQHTAELGSAPESRLTLAQADPLRHAA